MTRARCEGRAGATTRRTPPAARGAAADPLRAGPTRGRRRNWAAALTCAVLLASVAGATSVVADEKPAEGGWGYALADELMSPWCPGFALPDCSSGYASDLRLWILEQEKLGRSREDVKAEILAKYGEKMLQAPKAEGRGLFAYAIPAALIAVGLAVLVAFLRKQGAGAAAGAGSAPSERAVDPSLLSRVDRELASYESPGSGE